MEKKRQEAPRRRRFPKLNCRIEHALETAHIPSGLPGGGPLHVEGRGAPNATKIKCRVIVMYKKQSHTIPHVLNLCHCCGSQRHQDTSTTKVENGLLMVISAIIHGIEVKSLIDSEAAGGFVTPPAVLHADWRVYPEKLP